MSRPPETSPQTQWRLPPPIKAGGTIYVCSAAGTVSGESLQAGMEKLTAAGFQLRHQPSLVDSAGYLAGSDEARLADLSEAMLATDVDAIICARGGYGTMRLLDRLPWEAFSAQPKWLVGYSDITAFHLAAATRGIQTLHGPMVAGLEKHVTPHAFDALIGALADRPADWSGLRTRTSGAVTGRLLGGNLTMLAALAGTPFMPSLRGAILVLEEIGEPPYRLDRLVTTLRLSGALDGIAGLVLGQFTRCGTESLEEVAARLFDLLGREGIPAVWGASTGHDDPNLSWRHGGLAQLDATAGRLTMLAEPSEPVTQPERPRNGLPTLPLGAIRPGPAGIELLRGARPANGVFGLLDEALTTGICSAAQLAVWRRGELTHRIALGTTAITADGLREAVTQDTRFDIASVTKAVCTALLAHLAVVDGRVSFEDEIPRDISACRATFADLLRHGSGLPAYERLWEQDFATADAAWRHLATIPVRREQRGHGLYSDVGYLLLGRWIERLLGAPLDRLFDDLIAKPLALTRTGFQPVGGAPQSGFAATEWCGWRRRTIQGEVHDENAALLGGVTGHAGLFSTAFELSRIGLAAMTQSPQLLTLENTVRMWNRAWIAKGGSHTLGWDTPSGPRSSAGTRMSQEASFGHLGFAGSSLWIDAERGVVVALLTNRIHPTRDNAGIRALRPALHDAVMRELGF